MGKQRVEHIPQGGQLPSFSACCGSSGGSQPGLLAAGPAALCPGARALLHSPEATGLQGMGLQISYTLLVQTPGRDHPSHAGMCWDPAPDPAALLFCVATRSSRGERQWQSPLAPVAAGTGASCSAEQHFVAPHCCCQGQQHSPWLLRLRAPALHSHGLGRNSCRQYRGDPAARGIHCLLSAVVPQDPVELLHVVAQSWALTPKESQQSSTGILCCVEELKQVVPLAGHKAEASYRCLLQVTSGPS